jgi:hypothetical protein
MKHIPVLFDDLAAIAKSRHVNQKRKAARLNPNSLANQLRRSALVNGSVRNIDKLIQPTHAQCPRSIHPSLRTALPQHQKKNRRLHAPSLTRAKKCRPRVKAPTNWF